MTHESTLCTTLKKVSVFTVQSIFFTHYLFMHSLHYGLGSVLDIEYTVVSSGSLQGSLTELGRAIEETS